MAPFFGGISISNPTPKLMHWGHQHGLGWAIGQLMANAVSPPSTSSTTMKRRLPLETPNSPLISCQRQCADPDPAAFFKARQAAILQLAYWPRQAADGHSPDDQTPIRPNKHFPGLVSPVGADLQLCMGTRDAAEQPCWANNIVQRTPSSFRSKRPRQHHRGLTAGTKPPAATPRAKD